MTIRALARLALVCICATAPALAQQPPPPQTVSQYRWQAGDERLNRFTAIHTDDGAAVMLLTDQGALVAGRVQRGPAGAISGVEIRAIRYLRDQVGAPLSGPWRDAQGIAVTADGRIFVSFEGHGRVWAYAAPGAPATALPTHPDFARLSVGAGLSALAVSRSGVVYAIPQRAARMTYGIPSYHYWNDEWAGSFRLPTDGDFFPVAADIGPDGHLYLLERADNGGGRRAQLRRFVLQGSRIDAGAVVMRSAAGEFGELRGLSVWRGRDGGLRALMVSHARVPGQPSMLVEVVLPR